jgi:hypothetical protein
MKIREHPHHITFYNIPATLKESNWEAICPNNFVLFHLKDNTSHLLLGEISVKVQSIQNIQLVHL